MNREMLVPLIVLAIMIPVVLLRNRAPRVLHPERLWIIPAIVIPLIGLGLWGSQFEPGARLAPFGVLDWSLLVVGLLLGLAFGWQRGRMTTIEKTPDGVLKAQASRLGVMLILLVVVARSALRPWTTAHAADWHVSPLAIGDAFLLFAAGTIVAQRVELFIRARRIRHGGTDPHVEAVAS